MSVPPSPALPRNNATIKDHIYGMVIGSALGDTIGLYTEFMTKAQAEKAYPRLEPRLQPEFRLYPNNTTPFHMDRHRSRFVPRHWTDDTDHALCILLSYVHNGGQIDAKDFAERLSYWRTFGTLALGTLPLGLGSTVNAVLSSKKFLSDPVKAAYEVWKPTGNVAANGSLMRIHPLGAMCVFKTLNETFEITTANSTTTHADPRCVFACLIQVGLIRGLLRGEVTKQEDIDDIFEQADTWYGGWSVEQERVGRDEYFDTYDETIREATTVVMHRYFTFAPLQLDEKPRIGYVFKALGAAVRCLRVAIEFHEEDKDHKLLRGQVFQKLITDLAMEAGDADTNACIAGALLGAYLGWEDIPAQWRDNLRHGVWLQRMTEGMCRILGVGDGAFDVGDYPDAARHGGVGFPSKDELEERWDTYRRKILARTTGLE
ncbi:hypothetical protein Vi05172_g130 [Venturia inaequalis]|nr:hypothetical protein Vi05172_g130 [Venturia inaequalis]